MRTFTLSSGNNIYSETYGNNYYTDNISGSRAYRNATSSTHKTLARTIAANHSSELKEAFEYLEDGNVSAFQDVINNIKTNESAKQRYYNITDSEISSAIESAYEQVVGADYDNSISATKLSSERTGFVEGITLGIPKLLGIGDYTSSAEYIAERRGTEVNETEQAARLEGRIKGGAMAGGLVLAGATIATKGLLLKGIAAICTGPIGWFLLGAAVVVGGAAIIASNAAKTN